MIVRAAGAHLHLITQPDHAALARRVMERWGPLHDAERRRSILLAVEEHDNGWREPDAAPTVDAATGRIHDFINTPVPVRQAVWPRGVLRLADSADDPWAAALVAQHAITIHDRYRLDARWTAFFDELAALRDTLVAAAGRTHAQLTHDYQFVRIGDLISLVFCNRWDEEQFDRWAFRRSGDEVTIAPDPFEGRDVPIAVAATEIPNRPYASDEDLRTTLRHARRVALAGVCRGLPLPQFV